MIAIQKPLVANQSNTDILFHKRRIAWTCLVCQYWAAVIYLVCYQLFPDSHQAAVGCGSLAITLALIPLIYAVYYKQFWAVLSCIAAFNLAPIWFLYLEAVLPGYDAFVYAPSSYRMEAFFWVALFQLFGNLFYYLLWRTVTSSSINFFSLLTVIRPKHEFYVRLTLVAFIVPPFLFYLYYGSAETLWMAISSGRTDGGATGGGLLVQGSIGDVGSLMLPINSFWQLTPLFSIIAFTTARSKTSFWAILCLCLGLLIVFAFFLSGSRGTMMFVGAPILFFLVYYNWERGWRFWLTLGIIFIALIGVMEFQVRFRGNLLGVLADPVRAAQERGYQSATTFDPTESHRDNNMYLLCFMVQGYPDKYSFEGFNNYFAALLNPVPRVFWPGKPVMVGAKDLSQQYPYVLDGPIFIGTTSLSTSVVGDAYQVRGFLGILVYAFTYALFFLFFDGVTYYANPNQPITIGLMGIGVFLSFWGYRAFFALIVFSYPVIIVVAGLKLMSLFSSKQHENYLHSA